MSFIRGLRFSKNLQKLVVYQVTKSNVLVCTGFFHGHRLDHYDFDFFYTFTFDINYQAQDTKGREHIHTFSSPHCTLVKLERGSQHRHRKSYAVKSDRKTAKTAVKRLSS